jgi:4-aminobutyrate aminotransferase-like enzyme
MILRRGDLLPRIRVAPPGPRSRALSRRLARIEPPGVNTLWRGEPAILWREARGANVVDVDGNRYLDFTSGFGVAAVGHRHPRVVAAARRQAAELVHGLGDVAAHPRRVELAERLAALAPVDDPQVYFAISGADAVEIALKTALLASGRAGILAFEGAYHGVTLGALQVTARPEFQRPFRAHFHGHVHRLPFGAAARDIATLLARRRIGAAIVEPILGREGVVLPPAGWLAELARLCRHHGALLVADEIFTGCGRTGTFFAVEGEGVRPDLLCCGKALGGGYPISAVVGRREVMRRWSTDGEALHTATFVAHPVACAAALATLDVLRRERLPQRAARLGPELGERLRALAQRRRRGVARGRGLVWALELGNGEAARGVAARARGAGLLLLAAGPRGSVLELAPPLTTSERQLDAGLAILAGAL